MEYVDFIGLPVVGLTSTLLEILKLTCFRFISIICLPDVKPAGAVISSAVISSAVGRGYRGVRDIISIFCFCCFSSDPSNIVVLSL